MGSAHSSVRYRPVKGFPGYEVGDDGSVWSRLNGRWGLSERWKRLKPIPHRYGHLRVFLRLSGKTHTKHIHHLVLEAFIGPCPEGMEGCHNDGNPKNNRWTNLRWDTHANNLADREQHGTMLKGEKHGMAKLTEGQVKEMRSLYATGDWTYKEIGMRFKIHPMYAFAVIKRKKWKHLED